ncbi:hypothetical protein HNR00_003406 [Methylorubrum rhodinum]|uniref:Uncharacterized protein n=1 Tax=Methylorubrum rhodinum TaxID=29428 RepID=A0A840ZPM5_9HYPH|nr:hypothetical protein [Methylorubrum rhodinum]MBB5758683.1 hypothetical protein [Methylorubrum rhodinum]
MTTIEEPTASFYAPGDAGRFRTYAEREFGVGSYLDLDAEAGERDEILIAGLLSARDYMMQSAGCRNAAGAAFRVHPGLVETIRPNAFAAHHRGLHLCGLSSGLYGAMFELCLFVMAQPGVFPEIGEPRRETATPLPPGIVPGFWMIDALRAGGAVLDRSVAATLVPKCPARYRFAVMLTLHMMRFVWFHELYHCLNGHIGVLRRVAPAIRLNEMPEAGGAAAMIARERAVLAMAPAAFLQAIELDADRSALWGVIQTQAQDRENIFALQAPAPEQRIEASLFTAYLITVIFDEAGRRLEGGSAGTHPDPYTRLHNLIRTTAAHLLDAHPATNGAFRGVIGTFRALKGVIPALSDADTVLDDCCHPAFQGLLDEKEELLDTARGHFAPFGFR